jgi:hypothetical protein
VPLALWWCLRLYVWSLLDVIVQLGLRELKHDIKKHRPLKYTLEPHDI